MLGAKNIWGIRPDGTRVELRREEYGRVEGPSGSKFWSRFRGDGIDHISEVDARIVEREPWRRALEDKAGLLALGFIDVEGLS